MLIHLDLRIKLRKAEKNNELTSIIQLLNPFVGQDMLGREYIYVGCDGMGIASGRRLNNAHGTFDVHQAYDRGVTQTSDL